MGITVAAAFQWRGVARAGVTFRACWTGSEGARGPAGRSAMELVAQEIEWADERCLLYLPAAYDLIPGVL